MSASLTPEEEKRLEEIEKKDYLLTFVKNLSYLCFTILLALPLITLIEKFSVWSAIFSTSDKAAGGCMALYLKHEGYKNIFSLFTLIKDEPVKAILNLLSIVSLLLMLLAVTFTWVIGYLGGWIYELFTKDKAKPARAPFYARYEERLRNLSAEERAKKAVKTKVLFAKYLVWKCVRLFLLFYFPFKFVDYMDILANGFLNAGLIIVLVVNLGVSILRWWYEATYPVETKNFQYLDKVLK